MLTQKEREYIKQNYAAMGAVAIAKELHRDKSTIWKAANKMGLRGKHAPKRIPETVRENLGFDTIPYETANIR